MANVYQSATDLIGKTPLLEVTKLEKNKGLEAKVLVKLEYLIHQEVSKTVLHITW